jgi:hypothetical protein
MKKPRLLLAALILLIGAASAAGSRPPTGSNDFGENAIMFHKQLAGNRS